MVSIEAGCAVGSTSKDPRRLGWFRAGLAATLACMTTLRIEHPVTDFTTWQAAFDRFSEMRAHSGVLTHHIWRPVDDDHFVTLDLEFASIEAAEAFLGLLQERIWAVPANSPALAGSPTTRFLQPAS